MQRDTFFLVLATSCSILGGSGVTSAQSCFGIKDADIALSQRSIENACARDRESCYGEARRWQNVVKYFENRVCPGTDRALLSEHNAAVRSIVRNVGRDRGVVARHNEAVRENDRPRGYAPGGYRSDPPSNPNPFGLYGSQPSSAPCTRYTLNADGSKHCF